MMVPKTLEEINRLIADGVEENISLDYKAGDALQNTDGKKKEIAKDVSAMANSAGGVIVYGVREFNDDARKHLPEAISPIDRTAFSKEQLEQIISSNISPKIDGLLIHPISADEPNKTVYVVEIPQSSTAHQNTRDHRYYKRFNFESVPMVDYEIRDVMSRSTFPFIELILLIEKITRPVAPENSIFAALYSGPFQSGSMESNETQFETEIWLRFVPANSGRILAQYINYFVRLPEDLVHPDERHPLQNPKAGIVEFSGENTHRDIVDAKIGLKGGVPVYGPSRFDPVLPGLIGKASSVRLVAEPNLDERELSWTVHADNAAPRAEKIKLNEIEVVERHEKPECDDE